MSDDAQSAGMGATGWHLIETAPKDGSHILVRNSHNPNIPPTTVHWFDGGWHLSVNQIGEYSEYIWGPPTHWVGLWVQGAADTDEAYEIGKRDGYEDAIQDLDLATGGDGEFFGSTIPGRTVDLPAMKARIIARCGASSLTEGDRGAEPAEVGQLHEAMDLLHKARLSSIHHATDKAALRKALEHIAELYIRAPGFAAPDPTTELVYGMYRTACDALRALGASTVASTDRNG